MTASNPPRLASALLRWMGPRDEALLGDLLEHYRAGRSDWWYWRQVLAAIFIGAAVAIRAHKFLATRAIVIGWLVVWLYANYAASFVLAAASTVVGFKTFLFVTGITDWFWVHNIDLPAAVVRSAPSIVTTFVGAFVSGWLVGYVNRAHGPAMVLAFCTTLPLPALGAIVERLVKVGAWDGPPLVLVTAYLLPCFYLPTLVAGLWAVRQRRHDSPPSSVS